MQRIRYLHNFCTVIFRLHFFVAYLFLCSVVYGQIKTNQELAELQTRAILDSISLKLPVEFSSIGFDTKLLKDEEKSFLLNNFIKYYSGEGKSISLDSCDIKISFEIFSIETTYIEKSLKLIGLNRTLQRNIQLSVSGYIRNYIVGNLENPFNFERTFSDSIDTDMLERVEASPYYFLKGKSVEALSWTKYIEPGLIILSVSSLIYLFFTMRY